MVVEGLGGSDKTGMTEEGVSGGDRIRGKICGLIFRTAFARKRWWRAWVAPIRQV